MSEKPEWSTSVRRVVRGVERIANHLEGLRYDYLEQLTVNDTLREEKKDLLVACKVALPLVKALAKHQEHNGETLFPDEPIMHDDDVRKIEAAIAKAEGRT